MEEESSWWKKTKNFAKAIGTGIKEGAKQTGKAMSYVGDSIMNGGKCYMCLKPAECDITCGHILCKNCLAFYIESQGNTKLDQIPCFICAKPIPFEFTQDFWKKDQGIVNLEEEKVPARKMQKIPKKPDLPSKDPEEISSISEPSNPIIKNPPSLRIINTQANKADSDPPKQSEPINNSQSISMPDLIIKDPTEIKSESPQSKYPNSIIPPPFRPIISHPAKESGEFPQKFEPNNKLPFPPALSNFPPIRNFKEDEKSAEEKVRDSVPSLIGLSSSDSESDSSVEVSI